jgi:epoxyqueuosine reductase
MSAAEEKIKAKARELGFTKAGIARAGRLDAEAEHLQEWLTRGYQGSMDWMARNFEKRVDPREILPGASSIIAVAMNYYADTPHPHENGVGKISRYAWGDDYHDILTPKLKQLCMWMEVEFPAAGTKPYVDTGPVMDKVWAERAGIGWEGKHTNVITQDVGSWVFLGEVITTLELIPDQPGIDHCGTCTLCLEACPTQAIVEPYVVDSNLCLSYLTIEHRGDINAGVKGQFEGWIYGCDICQDVCPWNHKFAAETNEAGFLPREGNIAPRLEEWKEMSIEEFRTRFKGSPVKRTKLEGLVRNISIVNGSTERAPG